MKKSQVYKFGKLGKCDMVVMLCATVLLITPVISAVNTYEKNICNDNKLIIQDKLSYEFSFLKPTIVSKNIEDSYYDFVSLDGCIELGSNIGDPILPVKFVKILIPAGKTVSNVEVIGSAVDVKYIQNKVFPNQGEIPIGSSDKPDFEINTQIYSSDAAYPTYASGSYHIGYCRGYEILDISLNPVQYLPTEDLIRYYPSLYLVIDLVDDETVNQFFRDNIDDKNWVEKLVYNPEVIESYENPNVPVFEYPGGLCDPSDDYDYVIITTTYNGLDYWSTGGTLTYNWDDLMDKHESDDGLECTLITIQDIDACTDYHSTNPLFNDQEAHIREFCKDAYEDWGTDYIFIGGDDEWIPAREMAYYWEDDVDSDIYWSNLDSTFNEDGDYYWGEAGDNGFDLYAELFIGRITCDEPQDVSNWMTKSFYYADSDDLNYLDNAGFYGGALGWPCQGDDFIDFGAIKGTDNWLGPNPGDHGPYPTWLGFQFGFETWNNINSDSEFDISTKWTAETPNPGWQGGYTSSAISGLKTAINNDEITLLSAVAHANSDMSMDVGDDDWESNYHNTKPFFLIDFGCHCGDMDASDDGVLHSMLFHSDTELAFACVYNTCYGWGSFYDTNSSSALQMKSFWDYIFDLENNSNSCGNWQLGKALAWSKDLMAPTIDWSYNGAQQSWRSIIQGCLLFGDPAQKLKPPMFNSPPEIPSLDGPTSGKAGKQYIYELCSTDPDGDDVIYCIDFGDESGEICIGPFSSGTCALINHTWAEEGTYSVKAKATDINGASSDYATLEVVMPVNKVSISIIQLILERFPNAFLVLRTLLGLLI